MAAGRAAQKVLLSKSLDTTPAGKFAAEAGPGFSSLEEDGLEFPVSSARMLRPGRILLLITTAVVVAASIQWFLARGLGFTREVSADGDTVWTGAWHASRGDVYEVTLGGDDAALFVDNVLIARRDAESPRMVWIGEGWHQLRVIAAAGTSTSSAPSSRIGAAGGTAGSIAPDLRTALPANPRLHAALTAFARLSWLLAAAGVIALAVRIGRDRRTGARLVLSMYLPPEREAAIRRAVIAAGLAVVLAYGIFLRFDAITLKYGPVSSPGWLHDLQSTRARDSALRPAGMTWDRVEGRYISDPYTYLIHAREMRHFYGASPREPVFPAATRAWLFLLGNQDVAVSFASATFSVLLILATFLLGREAFSPVVGLAAAALTAIEYDFVTWGVSGWRDDAFACGVVLSACAMLRYARTGSPAAALLAGFVGGLSCLVRITSLSFLAPGFLWLLVTTRTPWRGRLSHIVAAAGMTLIVIAPFLITCWQTYGDPLYSINVHADVYRAAAGENVATHQTAAEYLKNKWLAQPSEMLATFIHGMTSYPFANKWVGFARWTPWLGPLLAALALAGLAAWIATAQGRLLLIVLASSLLPYSMTWKLGADWRFTEHAYPFFLVAAPSAIWLAVLASQALLSSSWAVNRRRIALALIWTGALVAAWFITVRTLPATILRKQLLRGEAITLEAGGTGSRFIGDGWSRPIGDGNVISRVLVDTAGTLRLSLPEARAYDLTMRIDPFPRPFPDAPMAAQFVDVKVNGQTLQRIDLQWTPDRVGAYNVSVPATVVRPGVNTLTLETRAPRSISLWHIRVRPVVQ